MADQPTQTPVQSTPSAAQFGTQMVATSPSGIQLLTAVTVAEANTLLTIASLSNAQLAAILGALLHPVGSLYFSTTSTNPAVSLGFGTWIAFGAGRVPVSIDSGQVEFDTLEEIGGEKTHALTSAENGPHTHPVQDKTNAAIGNNTQTVVSGTTAHDQTGLTTGFSGSGTGHNNLPPYIVVSIWKRTA